MPRELPAFSYDFSRWPLVQVHIRRACEESEVWNFYTQLESHIARNEPYYTVCVIDNDGPVNTAHSRVGNKWMAVHGEDAIRLNLGSTIVLANPIMRALVRAYMLFNKMPSTKYRFAATTEEAMRHAQNAFARLGMSIPTKSN